MGARCQSNMAGRVSFTEDDSGSYYNEMYFHQQSLFASVIEFDDDTPSSSRAGWRIPAIGKTTASIESIRS